MFPEFPFFKPVTVHVIYKVTRAFKGQTSQMDFGKESFFKKPVCTRTYYQRLYLCFNIDTIRLIFLQSDVKCSGATV